MADVGRPAEEPGVRVEAPAPSNGGATVPTPSGPQGARGTWLGLLGFMNNAEGVGVATGQGVPLREEESTALIDRVQKARCYAEGLGSRVGDAPTVREIDPSLHSELTGLPSEPSFQQHLVEIESWSFSWIELKKLIVFQPLVNLDYVSARMAEAGRCKEPVEAIRFCLPLTANRPKAE